MAAEGTEVLMGKRLAHDHTACPLETQVCLMLVVFSLGL